MSKPRPGEPRRFYCENCKQPSRRAAEIMEKKSADLDALRSLVRELGEALEDTAERLHAKHRIGDARFTACPAVRCSMRRRLVERARKAGEA